MKRCFILILILVFSSCSTFKYIEYNIALVDVYKTSNNFNSEKFETNINLENSKKEYFFEDKTIKIIWLPTQDMFYFSLCLEGDVVPLVPLFPVFFPFAFSGQEGRFFPNLNKT